MKRNSLYKWMCRVACVTLGMAGLAACSSEDDESGLIQGPSGSSAAIASDAFIVDYGVGAEAATRAGKAERITSLFYLVYDSDGKLLKARKIPDINAQTTWPLTRDNMTWAQREALKDTLNSRNTYTAFFLANAQSQAALAASSEQADLLLEPNRLSTAQLCLPQTPFDDTNMMYLWKETIKYQRPEGVDEDKDVPRNHPLSKQIVLRRILSRVEVTRIQATDHLITSALEKCTDYWTKLADNTRSVLTDFVNAVKSKVEQPTLWTLNLEALKTLLQAKVTEGKLSLEKEYQASLLDKVKEDASYQARMADWNTFSEFSLKMDKACNRFSLSDLLFDCDETASTEVVHRYQLEVNKAVWIGFSEHEMSADGGSPTLNEWKGFSFYQKSADGNPVLEIEFDKPFELNLRKNTQGIYECNPVATICSDVGDYTGQVTYKVDMSKLFGTVEELVNDSSFKYEEGEVLTPVNKKNFIKAINEVLHDAGHSWTAFNFNVSMPEHFNYTATIAEK